MASSVGVYCFVYCIFGQFLPCFKLFYNILHCTCLGIFSQTSVGPCASEYFVCSNLKDTSDKPNMIVAASKCTPEKQSCIGMWFIFAQTKGLAVFDGSWCFRFRCVSSLRSTSLSSCALLTRWSLQARCLREFFQAFACLPSLELEGAEKVCGSVGLLEDDAERCSKRLCLLCLLCLFQKVGFQWCVLISLYL